MHPQNTAEPPPKIEPETTKRDISKFGSLKLLLTRNSPDFLKVFLASGRTHV